MLVIGLLSGLVSPLRSLAGNELKRVKYPYLLFVPENYDSIPGKSWPVIFYLHGASARGNNLESVKRYGLPYFLSKGKKLDCIVVAPQCPWKKNWASENWFDPVYEEVASKLRVDSTRIYLTGMSLGGFGTWALALRMPDRFAAIAPLCGGGEPQWASTISNIPTWVFHGTADNVVPIRRSQEMVDALRKQHADNVKFTRLQNKGHDINRVYNDDDLYSWMKQFSLKNIADNEILKKVMPIWTTHVINNLIDKSKEKEKPHDLN